MSSTPFVMRERRTTRSEQAYQAITLQLEHVLRLHGLRNFTLSAANGLVLARAGHAEESEALAAYGRNIGLAFQIADDVLDATSDDATLGKTTQADTDNEKSTFVALMGLERSRARARELVSEALTHLEVFGPRAEGLRALAHFTIERSL